jgi:hypothetical protein
MIAFDDQSLALVAIAATAVAPGERSAWLQEIAARFEAKARPPSRQARSREASASEPLQKRRKRIRRCQNRGVTLPAGPARAMP